MKVQEATVVKQKIMKYAFWERNGMAVVTEGLNMADVLSVTKHKQSVEYEIKVSRADLRKELAAIKYATITMIDGKDFAPDDTTEQQALNLQLGDLKNKSGGWSKINKHQSYVNPKAWFEKKPRYVWEHQYMPNYFYMVVPRKLVDFAVAELAGLPYGVIAYDGCRSDHKRWNHETGKYEVRLCGLETSEGGCYEEVTVKKKAGRIHEEKIDDRSLLTVMQRTCTENIRMLSEIIDLNTVIEKMKTEEIAA